jgi:hypothetical protein
MNAKDSTNPIFNIFSTGIGIKRKDITWEKGKKGKWRRNGSSGGERAKDGVSCDRERPYERSFGVETEAARPPEQLLLRGLIRLRRIYNF